jgi:ribonuclease HII
VTAGHAPTVRFERALMRDGHSLVAGMDEVGRGALAGPVSVGVAVVADPVGRTPSGLRDSKLLTPEARSRLVPRIRRWSVACAVGHAGPDEIDAFGIIAALRLAGLRALAALPERPDVVLLDGNHDWLSSSPQGSLFDTDTADDVEVPSVVTQVKADLRCSVVAAASVLAKTERDDHMVALSASHPRYAWADNKGYAAPAHVEALAQHGPTELHRRSWRLPGCGPDNGDDWGLGREGTP